MKVFTAFYLLAVYRMPGLPLSLLLLFLFLYAGEATFLEDPIRRSTCVTRYGV